MENKKKGKLLGVKIISWLIMIAGLGAVIRYGIVEKSIGASIEGSIRVLLGALLLRGYAKARVFVIFVAYLSVVILIIHMFVSPLILLDIVRKDTAYQKLAVQLRGLEAKKAPEEDIIETKKEMNKLVPFPDHFATYKKKMGDLSKHNELNLFTIISLCISLFTIYYLKKPYVIKEFKDYAIEDEERT